MIRALRRAAMDAHANAVGQAARIDIECGGRKTMAAESLRFHAALLAVILAVIAERHPRVQSPGLLYCRRCRSMIEVDPRQDDLDDHMRIRHASRP